MTLIETDPPLAEPVTLAELKAHLRIDTNDEDALLESLIRVARAHLEAVTGTALMPRGLRLVLDDWPVGQVIQLMAKRRSNPLMRFAFMTSMACPGNWRFRVLLDAPRGPRGFSSRSRPHPGQAINGIEIEFTAGFGAVTEIPPELLRAVLIHAAYLYEFRGAVSPDMQPAAIPTGYDRLIAPWVRRAL
jgi:uncharacterized phiE125 gp8 family phage protein